MGLRFVGARMAAGTEPAHPVGTVVSQVMDMQGVLRGPAQFTSDLWRHEDPHGDEPPREVPRQFDLGQVMRPTGWTAERSALPVANASMTIPTVESLAHDWIGHLGRALPHGRDRVPGGNEVARLEDRTLATACEGVPAFAQL